MIIIHSSGNLSANYSAMRWDKGIFNGSVGENGMKPDRIKDGTDVTDVYHKTTEEMERERDQVKGKASAQDLHVQKTCCPGSNLDLVAFVGHSSTPCKLTLCLHARTHAPCGISKHYVGVPSLHKIWCVEDLAVSDCSQRHLGYSRRHGELVNREISDHLRVGCQ